jgi:hypothetical protein
MQVFIEKRTADNNTLINAAGIVWKREGKLQEVFED